MMKDIKRHDERVQQSRANDGTTAVFTRAVANEADRALQALDSGPGASGGASGASSSSQWAAARPARGSPAHCAVGSGQAWRSLLSSLGTGDEGPAVHPDVTSGMHDAVLGWASPGSLCTFGPQSTYDERDFEFGGVSRRVLKPGHCVELKNHEYAQVLVANLQCSGLPAGTEPRILCAVFRHLGNHPELPLPHLLRDSLRVVPLSAVDRRARVVPIFRGVRAALEGGLRTYAPCEKYPSHFLVDNSVYPHIAGPADRRVYLSCPFRCGGRLRQPEKFGAVSECSTCKRSSPWF